MTVPFKRPFLLCNRKSGSHDEKMLGSIAECCRRNRAPLVATAMLPDDQIPDKAVLRGHEADLLIVWTGDGTVNAAAQRAAGWQGALLPLPGGTLNLLSKQLHGNVETLEILEAALSGSARREAIPTIASAGGEAYVTLVAGPATRWAELRETMREDGVIEAGREAPEAFEAMLKAPGVRLAGSEQDYPGIILTPTQSGLKADGVLAESLSDILRYGLAWLGGDFRDGPHEEIGFAQTMMIEGEGAISVERDGELGEAAGPARFALGRSAVDFVSTA